MGGGTGPLVRSFGLLVGGALLVLLLRAAHMPYTVVLAVKLGALAMYLRLGASIGVITRDNLNTVRDLVSGRCWRCGAARGERKRDIGAGRFLAA